MGRWRLHHSRIQRLDGKFSKTKMLIGITGPVSRERSPEAWISNGAHGARTFQARTRQLGVCLGFAKQRGTEIVELWCMQGATRQGTAQTPVRRLEERKGQGPGQDRTGQDTLELQARASGPTIEKTPTRARKTKPRGDTLAELKRFEVNPATSVSRQLAEGAWFSRRHLCWRA